MSPCSTVPACEIWQNTWKQPESVCTTGLLQKIADSPGNRIESLRFKVQMVIAIEFNLKAMRDSICPFLQYRGCREEAVPATDQKDRHRQRG